jgi:hypothetical protein
MRFHPPFGFRIEVYFKRVMVLSFPMGFCIVIRDQPALLVFLERTINKKFDIPWKKQFEVESKFGKVVCKRLTQAHWYFAGPMISSPIDSDKGFVLQNFYPKIHINELKSLDLDLYEPIIGYFQGFLD